LYFNLVGATRAATRAPTRPATTIITTTAVDSNYVELCLIAGNDARLNSS